MNLWTEQDDIDSAAILADAEEIIEPQNDGDPVALALAIKTKILAMRQRHMEDQ